MKQTARCDWGLAPRRWAVPSQRCLSVGQGGIADRTVFDLHHSGHEGDGKFGQCIIFSSNWAHIPPVNAPLIVAANAALVWKV